MKLILLLVFILVNNVFLIKNFLKQNEDFNFSKEITINHNFDQLAKRINALTQVLGENANKIPGDNSDSSDCPPKFMVEDQFDTIKATLPLKWKACTDFWKTNNGYPGLQFIDQMNKSDDERTKDEKSCPDITNQDNTAGLVEIAKHLGIIEKLLPFTFKRCKDFADKIRSFFNNPRRESNTAGISKAEEKDVTIKTLLNLLSLDLSLVNWIALLDI